jgi:hypothetical protein
MISRKLFAILALGSSLLATPAFADLTGFYVEPRAGGSSISLDTSSFAKSNLTVASKSTSGQVAGLLAGTNLSEKIALEFGYLYGGSVTARGVTPGGFGWGVNIRSALYTGGLAWRWSPADNSALTITVRGGSVWYRETFKSSKYVSSTADLTAAGVTAGFIALPVRRNGASYSAGLAASYKVNDHLSITGALDRFDAKNKVTSYTAGVRWTF